VKKAESRYLISRWPYTDADMSSFMMGVVAVRPPVIVRALAIPAFWADRDVGAKKC